MIYVHVPFCGSFCTYCDFYSEIACPGRDFSAYTDEVCREIRRRAEEIRSTLEVNTLYIGGGTPSVLPPMCLERIVRAVGEVTGGGFREFTVEVNPEDIVERGPEYVRNLKELGVNRISMGVQSLDDGILHWMNRRHDAAGAREAFRILRQAGMDNVSVDIIFGISHLTEDTLLNTLREIIFWSPEHISAYQLSIEDGSALAEMIESGRYAEASDEQCRRQYRLVCRELREAGYEHYEISNWARPGFGAVHNSAYWSRQPYVGVGPGAHSLLHCYGAVKERQIVSEGLAALGSRGRGPSLAWEGLVPRDQLPDRTAPIQIRMWNSQSLTGWKQESEALSDEEIREEEIMLGLRTLEGWNGRRLSEDEWFVSDGIISDILAQS